MLARDYNENAVFTDTFRKGCHAEQEHGADSLSRPMRSVHVYYCSQAATCTLAWKWGLYLKTQCKTTPYSWADFQNNINAKNRSPKTRLHSNLLSHMIFLPCTRYIFFSSRNNFSGISSYLHSCGTFPTLYSHVWNITAVHRTYLSAEETPLFCRK